MRWARAAAVAAVVVVAGVGLGGLLRDSASGGEPPHVIVYVIDTLRADHLSLYGYERATSPRLVELAEESVVFRRALAPSAWTKASIGSLFTGLFPSRHGALDWEHRLRGDVPTLAAALNARGYTTAGFVSNPNLLPVFGFDRGFDHYEDVGATRRGRVANHPGSRAEEVHERVFEFLAAAPEGPLFLYVHVLDPHSPYGAPHGHFRKAFVSEAEGAGDRNARWKALYDGEIAYVDHHLSELVRELRAREIFDDAVFLVTSDHGEEFGEHGETGHGHSLYQEQLHVPLLMRLPGGEHGGRTVERTVRLLDVWPTLAELTGTRAPQGIDGTSFASLVADGDGSAYRPVLFAELSHKGNQMASIQDGRYKLIRRRRPAEDAGVRLFDLHRDPGERHDLGEAVPEKRLMLLRALNQTEGLLRGGFFLRLRNGSGASERLRLTGTLSALDGRFRRAGFAEARPGRRQTLSADGTEVAFDVTLVNEPVPLRQSRPVIVDRARLGFRLEQAGRLRLEVLADGVPLPPTSVLLGRAPADALPVEIDSADPRLDVTYADVRSATEAGRRGATGRLYRLPGRASEMAEIGEEVRERLEALGYSAD